MQSDLKNIDHNSRVFIHNVPITIIGTTKIITIINQ